MALTIDCHVLKLEDACYICVPGSWRMLWCGLIIGAEVRVPQQYILGLQVAVSNVQGFQILQRYKDLACKPTD